MTAFPLHLAIETSNPTSGPHGVDGHGRLLGPGVAIGPGDGTGACLDAEALKETSRHDDDLLPAIDRLFVRCGAKPGDLARVGVSVGPGGYTGVRIAVAAAKLIAEASGAKAVAIASPLVAAFDAHESKAMVVCLASKNDRTHATLLPTREWWGARRDAVLELADEREAAGVDEMLNGGEMLKRCACSLGVIDAAQFEKLHPERLVADTFLPVGIRDWAERCGVEIVEPRFAPASALRLMVGEAGVDPGELTPVYPREPDAVRQWRARHASGK